MLRDDFVQHVNHIIDSGRIRIIHEKRRSHRHCRIINGLSVRSQGDDLSRQILRRLCSRYNSVRLKP